MQPIDKLLARIKWDKEFGDAAFAIGYLDRVREVFRNGALIWQRPGPS